MNRLRYLAAFAALLASTAPAAAQQPTLVPLDSVVAVVGDSVLLRSDVDIEIATRLQAMGAQQPDPVSVSRLEAQVLEDKVKELLLLQAALRDSTIVVTDRDVDASVNREMSNIERSVGGAANLDRALAQQGLTRAELRALKTAGYRRSAMIQQYLGKLRQKRKPPTVSEAEIRSYFESRRADFGERPATLTFRQIVVTPSADDSARALARRRAEEALAQVKAGEDFVAVAKRFTEEPGGRERGGDLGWFRRGAMVPEFEKVAFSMRPGAVSGIVESPFGFHIIKVEKTKGAEVQARHILIVPEKGDADIERTRETAAKVAEQLRAGVPADSLTAKHHDQSEQGRVGPYPRDQLPPEYVTALASAREGQVVGPFAITAGTSGRKWAVVQVIDVQEKGEFSLDDPLVHAEVRAQIEQQKLIDEIVGELRRSSYVNVRN